MTFHFKEAIREQTPLILGLVGPSGSGKTYSALRLATGIQSVVGGDIAFIDTEARRSLHYASKFKFKQLEFGPPFAPSRYLEALQAAVEIGARTIVVDSMSHEHEGAGGVLDWHEAELDRMAGADWKKRDALNFIAWAKPKADRRKLINGLLQLNANFILCFRAKEKLRMVKDPKTGKTVPTDAGWQAIAAEEFVYEATDRFLLLPGSKGTPDLTPDAWATGVPKMPDDHASIVGQGKNLNEEMGAALARWAQGGKPPVTPSKTAKPKETFDVQKVLATLATVGVSAEAVTEHLGHSPTADDRPALEALYRRERDAERPANTPEPAAQGGADNYEEDV